MMFNASQSIAAVGDSFTVGDLEYEVLTEDGTTGTVLVKRCTYYDGSPKKFHIPTFVENQSHSYQVVSIGENSFSWCKIYAVSIPDGVIKIEDGAFYRTRLESVSIPDSVTEIGDSSFAWCDHLAEVTLGKNVTSIGEYAFGRSSLTDILIPASVTFIGRVAFGNSFDLKNISVDPNNPSYSSNNGILFDKNKKVLIRCPNGKEVTNYTVPDSVNRIEEWAFSDCESLTEITIPDSVTFIGEGAFDYCTSLTDVTIGRSVNTIGDQSFCNCKSLIEITIPDSVISIGKDAFSDCESLTEITIPDNVTSIGDNAFEFCNSLTSVTIGNSVTSIGDWAFNYCSSLTNVYYRGDVPEGDNIYDNPWGSSTPSSLISYYPEGNATWEAAIKDGKWQNRGVATWNLGDLPDATNLTYTFKNGILTLTFTGTLQESTDCKKWTTVSGTQGSYTVNISKGKKFYRSMK